MISIEEATSILKNINFPGENDPTYSYCLSKTKRKDAVLSRSEDCEIAAAIELQSAWRGHRTRRKLRKIFGLDSFVIRNPKSARRKSLGCHTVKFRYKEYLHWCQEQRLDLESPAVLSFEDYCASVIQSWWRRRDCYSGHGGAGKTKRILDPHTAALLIQRRWRRYNDMKVFKFYRDLINFKGKGNPKMMLRCINPAEAKLLDKAAGVHVKFRLGGLNFPPSIYYKVFTRRPIVDLCACSPRDYTAMSYKQKLPHDLHNHPHEAPPPDDKEHWYKRYENNGWRPVSDRLFSNTQTDPITVQTSAKQNEFHYSKLKRKDNLEKKRKQKKISWLRKMYREGMVQTHKDLSSATVSAVQLATDQFMELSDQHPEAVETDDIDELLSWTTALNFDQYTTDWHISASTAFSDSKGDSNYDPFELTLTAPT